VGPRTGLDADDKELFTLPGIEPQSSSPQSDSILNELPWHHKPVEDQNYESVFISSPIKGVFCSSEINRRGYRRGEIKAKSYSTDNLFWVRIPVLSSAVW
jgi:hypothetical protein